MSDSPPGGTTRWWPNCSLPGHARLLDGEGDGRLGVRPGLPGSAGEREVAGQVRAQHGHPAQVPGLEPRAGPACRGRRSGCGRPWPPPAGPRPGRVRARPGGAGRCRGGWPSRAPRERTTATLPGQGDPARAGRPGKDHHEFRIGRHAGSRARHAGHTRSAAALLASRGRRGRSGHGSHVEDPVTAPAAVPVVFVHGLWLHATSWTRGSSCSPRAATTRSHPAGPATRPPRRGPGRTPTRWPGTASVT